MISPENEWEETTFTRPMRSPFSGEPRGPAPVPAPPEDVDVRLEEAALFEGVFEDRKPQMRALKRAPTPPPPPRPSFLPPPPTDEETTSKRSVAPELLRAMRELRESARLRQAVDLSKTVEEPTLDVEDAFLVTSSVRAITD